MITFCLNSWKHHRKLYLSGMKLEDIANPLNMIDHDFPTGYSQDYIVKPAIEKYGATIPSDLTRCSTLAYDILEIILEQKRDSMKTELLSLDPFPKSTIFPTHVELLITVDPKYSLHGLLNSFQTYLLSVTELNILADANRLVLIAQRYVASKSRTNSTSSITRRDVEGRALLSGIIRARETLPSELSHAVECKENPDVLRMLSKMVQYLHRCCDEHYPSDIQVAAGSCLGSLIPVLHDLDININQIPDMHSEKRTFFVENPLDHFFGDIFERLANYVQSDDTETAIIAKDTLKCIFSTNDGLLFWNEGGLKEEIKRIVLPFLTTEKIRYDVEDVPPGLLYKLLLAGIFNLSETKLEKDKSWCWNEAIWKCNTGSKVPYEDWIRNVVCAMLICCYGKDSNDQNLILSSMIRGTSDFFRPCLKLCASEYILDFLFYIHSFNRIASLNGITMTIIHNGRGARLCCRHISRSSF